MVCAFFEVQSKVIVVCGITWLFLWFLMLVYSNSFEGQPSVLASPILSFACWGTIYQDLERLYKQTLVACKKKPWKNTQAFILVELGHLRGASIWRKQIIMQILFILWINDRSIFFREQKENCQSVFMSLCKWEQILYEFCCRRLTGLEQQSTTWISSIIYLFFRS